MTIKSSDLKGRFTIQEPKVMRSLVATCIILALTSATALANPVGNYDVSGSNPDGSAYSGSVTVQKNGDTYTVTWSVGDKRYNGTGIGNDEFIAVSYESSGETGLALYSAEKENWKGIWSYAGGSRLGKELWTKK